MLDALSASLDYYQANFSPYQFKQARIVEFPDYASFAQSYPNTFAWSEGLGFIADLQRPDQDRLRHLRRGARVRAPMVGAPDRRFEPAGRDASLSETLAQYSALMVMEKKYGKDQIRRFLKQELDRYLRSRGTERLEELPLMRVENQQYIHYQKGGLVMYLLRDQIGEDAVNRALRRVLAQYAFKGAPYPRSLDLVAAIRAEAPADKQALITDLFEKITLYDVKTTGVTSTRRADGRFDVTVTVDARKLYVDGKGVETRRR
jgi:ABC-2 type transport system permease protein